MNRKILGLSGGDWFFVFQIAMAYVFAIPQTLRLFEDVRGVTITWLLFADIFVILNLGLSWETYRKVRTKEVFQALCIYANWALLITPMVVIMFLKCAWVRQDSLVAILIAVATVVVLLWARSQKRSLVDPAVRGILVGLFRMVPHLYLSYVILLAGSAAGIASKTVWSANITASARIVTLVLAGRKSGWNKGTVASLLSEIVNEGSWLLVTVIWVIYH